MWAGSRRDFSDARNSGLPGSGKQQLEMAESEYSKSLSEPTRRRYHLNIVIHMGHDPYILKQVVFLLPLVRLTWRGGDRDPRPPDQLLHWEPNEGGQEPRNFHLFRVQLGQRPRIQSSSE